MLRTSERTVIDLRLTPKSWWMGQLQKVSARAQWRKLGVGTPGGVRRQDTQGLEELDMQAIQAFLKGKAPKNLRIQAKGKKKLAQFLAGPIRPISRMYSAQLCASALCCFCGDLKYGDGTPKYKTEEETKEHMFRRCPCWDKLRAPYLVALRGVDFE